MIEVTSGEASNPELRKKLRRVVYFLENPDHLGFVNHRQNIDLHSIVLDQMRATLDQVLPVFDKPFQVSPKFGKGFYPFHFKPLDRIQRDYPHKGTNSEFVIRSVGISNHIVKEPV